jgi:hypothetical protein
MIRSAWALWLKPPSARSRSSSVSSPGVSQGRVADVVAQRQRLDEILVEGERPGQRAGDARHLERVGQPAAVVVAVIAGEDLGLVGQPAKGGGMDDPVAIALVRAAENVGRFGWTRPAESAACIAQGARSADSRLCQSVGRRGHRLIGHGPLGSAPRELLPEASSDWGSTRTPATSA